MVLGMPGIEQIFRSVLMVMQNWLLAQKYDLFIMLLQNTAMSLFNTIDQAGLEKRPVTITIGFSLL